jgi:hypothetical protein
LISLTPSLKSFLRRRPLARTCSPSYVLSMCYLLWNTQNNITVILAGILAGAGRPHHRYPATRPVGIAPHVKLIG